MTRLVRYRQCGCFRFVTFDCYRRRPLLATDSSQNIAWQTSYQPFGQASVSGTITQNLRLPGQYFDVESGWNHNGFRDYMPALGRYAEPDPLGMQGSARFYNPQTGGFLSEGPAEFTGSGANFYAYAGDDPIDNTDPTGCAAPGADCSAKLDAVRKAIDKLWDRLNDHAAHGGKDCNGMNHPEAIRQAANALAKAMAAAGSCLTEEEKEELEELLKHAYSQFQDNVYDAWQSLWKQLTTMPQQPSYGPKSPWVYPGSPVWQRLPILEP